ncbi:dTMP kinase [Priestia endophytica]|uniref:dTMP kinase n=1 Tax=Priestia endophytica TaxID=135735 RepID=UPI00227E5ABF|nr:dTMP kinase [Priestia endophytica]MCY8233844.1 dTMP kinase [Priestia endophytica]
MTERFITFEGPEGAGKTTIINKLQQELESRSIPAIFTREPGGIEISEKIRSIILDKEHTTMDGRTEALLYAAARRQHLVEKVIPSLKEGKYVICDRFIDSSLAYQGYAREIDLEAILSINSFAVDGYMPDITFYLDLDVEAGLERINQNKDREVNRLDLETLNFHRKVREGYLILQEKFPERIIKIDANRTVSEVFEDVLYHLQRKYKL